MGSVDQRVEKSAEVGEIHDGGYFVYIFSKQISAIVTMLNFKFLTRFQQTFGQGVASMKNRSIQYVHLRVEIKVAHMLNLSSLNVFVLKLTSMKRNG